MPQTEVTADSNTTKLSAESLARINLDAKLLEKLDKIEKIARKYTTDEKEKDAAPKTEEKPKEGKTDAPANDDKKSKDEKSSKEGSS